MASGDNMNDEGPALPVMRTSFQYSDYGNVDMSDGSSDSNNDGT